MSAWPAVCRRCCREIPTRRTFSPSALVSETLGLFIFSCRSWRSVVAAVPRQMAVCSFHIHSDYNWMMMCLDLIVQLRFTLVSQGDPVSINAFLWQTICSIRCMNGNLGKKQDNNNPTHARTHTRTHTQTDTWHTNGSWMRKQQPCPNSSENGNAQRKDLDIPH